MKCGLCQFSLALKINVETMQEIGFHLFQIRISLSHSI